MCAQTIILPSAPYFGSVIDSDLFAANALFTSNYLDPGSAYDRMLQEVGWSGLRFPGGTVTERFFAPGSPQVERLFDVTRPSGLSDDGSARIVTAPAVIDYVTERDLTLDFTLPTKNYYSEERNEDGILVPSQFGLYRIFDRVDNIIRGEYGEIKIQIFEIGNEYWYRGVTPLTPQEYGITADRTASGLQALFDSYQEERGGPTEWTQPEIGVQSGTDWVPRANEAIFSELNIDAREALDIVIDHYYAANYTIAGTQQGLFDRFDQWRDQEGIRDDLSSSISEWNIGKGLDLGLIQASGMLEMMRTMVLRDVDHAAVWGTQYFNLGTRLAALRNDASAPGGVEYTLTPAGEVYRMMSENLPGLQLIDVNTPASLREYINVPEAVRPENGAEQLVMHAYGNADTTIIFLSSRSDIAIDVTLDPGNLVESYQHVWGELLGVIDNPETPDRDEGDYASQFALSYIRTFNQATLEGSEGLSFTLQPYEVMKLEFTTGDVGVRMAGQDYMADPSANYDDDLSGKNFDDMIYGASGNDTLRGNAGDDTLLGGDGDDFLGGWTGNDLLDSGAGNDTLRGGPGNDILIARDGINLLRGDTDQDQFIVSVSGQTTIADFDLDGGEGLSFFKHYQLLSDVLDRTETVGRDLVVTHDGGGVTRIVGLGGRMEEFGNALTDFQVDSPVSELVDLLNIPPPDGSIPPDPDPVDPSTLPPEIIPSDEINAFLQLEDTDEVANYIRNLSPEEEDYLLDHINPNALALSANQNLWGAFCDNLTDEGFRFFIDGADPDILDMRYARIAAQQYQDGFDELLDEDRIPLCRTLAEISDEVRIDFFLLFTEEQNTQIESIWASRHPEEVGSTAEEIFTVTEEEVEARRVELQTTDAIPAFARFLRPGEFDKAYLALTSNNDDSGEDDDSVDEDEDENEDEEEDEDDSKNGGGCFVATFAYGDYDHPDVLYLRVFRDLVLSETVAGRIFIRVYYRVGPKIAKSLVIIPHSRKIVRWMLSRMVKAMRLKQSHNSL